MKIPLYGGDNRRIRKVEKIFVNMIKKNDKIEYKDNLRYLRKELYNKNNIKRAEQDLANLDSEIIRHIGCPYNTSEFSLNTKELRFDDRNYGVEYLTYWKDSDI